MSKKYEKYEKNVVNIIQLDKIMMNGFLFQPVVKSSNPPQSPQLQSQSEGAPGAKPKESSHTRGQHTPQGSSL